MKALFLFLVVSVSAQASTAYRFTTYGVQMDSATASSKDCLAVSCRRDVCAKAAEKLVKKVESDCVAIGGKVVVQGNLGLNAIALLDGHFSCQVSTKNRPDVMVCEL